jgi:hypothetical protein
MPNWNENRLVIKNNTPALSDYLKENGLSFKKIAPPAYPEERDEIGWNIIAAQTAAWGTKWDLDEKEQKYAANDLIENGECRFDTAWSPPIEAIAKLSEQFPDVDFELHYNEPGCAFYGTTYISDGMVNDECSNIEDKNDYVSFLVESMGYDQEQAEEAAGLNEDEEE